MRKSFIRLPRILAIAMALFLAVFALDVWEEHTTMIARAEALFIHLLPSILIVLALFLSWKKPRWGAIIFTFLGALYLFNEWGHWRAIGLLAAPLFVIGILFWVASMKSPQVD
jgi:hypothetical protein